MTHFVNFFISSMVSFMNMLFLRMAEGYSFMAINAHSKQSVAYGLN